MAQAFLEDQLVQFELRNDPFQPRVLLLKAFHLRQLRASHPTKPLPPIVVRRVADTDRVAWKQGCQQSLQALDFDNQIAEEQIAVKALNRKTSIGRAEYEPSSEVMGFGGNTASILIHATRPVSINNTNTMISSKPIITHPT
nr:hypothetical protein [uncultured Tateyamaria sp.]